MTPHRILVVFLAYSAVVSGRSMVVNEEVDALLQDLNFVVKNESLTGFIIKDGILKGVYISDFSTFRRTGNAVLSGNSDQITLTMNVRLDNLYGRGIFPLVGYALIKAVVNSFSVTATAQFVGSSCSVTVVPQMTTIGKFRAEDTNIFLKGFIDTLAPVFKKYVREKATNTLKDILSKKLKDICKIPIFSLSN